MSVNFSLNGVMQSACAGGSLADYIRDSARLRGTKIGCGEGGCGACTVMVTNPDGNAISVNSCLYPLAAVDGRAVTTVEGLGKNHAVPERIAALNGTQCGYCSPGFVMNMFAGLKKGNGSVTMRDMEGRMDGNICRCTGYRPLLDAAKSFATDSDVVDAIRGQDIKAMPKPDLSVADPPAALKSVKPAAEHKGDTTLPHVPAVWRKPANVADALAALADAAARPVGGSTSAGVYKSHLPGTLLKVDVRDLPELQGIAKEGNGLKVGAATTLTQLEAALRSFGTPASVALADHLLKVASVHVRNTATIAGNLMMAKTLGFWSDVATLLLGVGASVTWAKGVTESMEAFLASPDAPNRLVQSVTIPLDAPRIQSYRVAARPLFAHAFLNACFTANVEGGKITAFNAAYGCVSEPDVPGSHAILCPKTAAALVGQPLGDATLKAGLAALAAEVAPVGEDAAYRASLAASFLAKFLASLEGPQAPEPPRPMHSSTQSWDKAELAGPMHQPLVKIEASRQCDGSAQFVADIPMREGTLHGAFVKSSRARAVITAIDTAPALALGAVRVITAADIPGANDTNALGPVRPIFADKKVTFHAQQLALVLAPTPQLAAAAAAAVKVTYADDEAPAVCSLEQGMASTEAWCHPPVANDFNSADKDAEALIKAAPEERKVSGRVNVGGQQHFYMEPQAAYAFTDEDGVVQVHCPSQWHAATVGKIAAAVGVSQSRIRLVMRRAGGGFGGKLCHQIQFGAAAAVAAVVTGNPVKIVLDRVTDLQICGGREETIADYECAFAADGKIEAIKMHAWLNGGFTHELSFFANMVVPQQLNQVYHLPAFKLHSENVLTNTAVRTAMRGPGDMAATYTIETVLEHIATKLGVDPNAIREVNMISDEPAAFEEQKKLPNGTALEQQDYTAPAMWRKLKAADRGDYEAKKREVDDFNAKNKWKKRGVSMTPLRYGLSTFPKTALVNISTDGSVVCHAGGSEIGQGLCTKVAMAAAHELGKLYDGKVDLMPHIRVAECDSTIVPNQTFTGGSTSSEASMGATMDACAKLVAQMKPVLETLRKAKEGGEEVSWVELCGAAGNSFPAQPQCLVQSGHWSNTGEQAVAYNTYGVGLTVVEVDVLTGETQVLYTRFIYDCGKSINPAIDIGQAEGAFVIALGHVLQEQVVIDDKTGEVTSASTWKYKPPLAVNLPTEFICEFNDTPHAKGILSSKASGEPPMCLAISGVGTAVRHAVAAARKDFGHDPWCELPIPLTPPVVAAACGAKL